MGKGKGSGSGSHSSSHHSSSHHSPSGSNFSPSNCAGDTAVVQWATNNGQVTFYNESVATGCGPAVGTAFVTVNQCLYSRGFRIVAFTQQGNTITYTYVRC